ncbi:Y-family DNA polymerase [Vibrio tapetis]|uniref:Putative Nucleotidyltransferase/DNA polymerase involved in DNA repair n=1 Tax=Vibrio tapetis subsp. tapetis TaxID=1671868 RepID=A0A2N8ZCW0_9VIBR|nr:DNA polymerase Y family protein [Vibrio tapetis]SON49739.1 putative Nucleotidyltransferase/DNA polymerase involved in DNA repair [Vibrio tapetis subsp. tapetis]
MLWIYLNFPSLQLDSCFGLQSQDKPESTPAIIIVNGQDHRVVQYNAQAQQAGITLNMGLGTAASLCHPLEVHPYQASVEHRKLKEIAHWLYMVTCDITLFEPNGILLRVTNMLNLYEGLDKYWHTVQQHLNVLDVHYDFASGCSPLMAQLLAENSANSINAARHKLLASIRKYPLSASRLPHKTVNQLERVGIQQLGDLLSVPMADLAKRFDIDLVNYIGRLIGQFKHPIEFYHPPSSFQCHLDLLFEIDNVQWLQKPLEKLLTQLEYYLKLRDQLANELKIQLLSRDGSALSLGIFSAQGDYLAAKWQELAQLTLESVALTAPVLAIELSVVQIAEQSGSNDDLFSGKQGNTTPLELLSRLQAKLGKEAVKGIQLGDDARPEVANQYIDPLITGQPKSGNPVTSNPALRPSFMLPTPQRLSEQVTLIQGPERIATGWWDDNSMVRDYFIARSQLGRWLWVFRNREHHWFVHGYFS